MLAEHNSQPIGYSLASLNYSTWKGGNLNLEELFLVEPQDAGLVNDLYQANLQLARNCHLVQVRGLLNLVKSPIIPDGFSNVTKLESWDILQLPSPAMEKLAENSSIDEKRKLLAAQNISIAPTVPEDIPGIIQLIQGMAIYHDMEEDCWMNSEILNDHLFNKQNKLHANLQSSENLFNMWSVKDGDKIIGYCCLVPGFSTHENSNSSYNLSHGLDILGKYMYLEDLYVSEEYRGYGIGINLIQTCCRFSLEHECSVIRWSAASWNSKSLKFYENLGAKNVVKSGEINMFREDLKEIRDNDKQGWYELVF